MSNDFGMLTVTEWGKTRTFPTYTCGHCSSVVVLNPMRSRPRTTCLRCGRWICEQGDICATHCTPLPEIARDHLEGAGEWGKFVPAIMAGVQNKEEALEKGLILL